MMRTADGIISKRALGWLAFAILVLLLPSCTSAQSDTFTYDANGNMIGGSGFNFIYDDANQLAKITKKSDGSTVAEYFYDANGQRTKKIEGGITTYYVGDYAETRVSGGAAATTSYYFANNERVARKDPDGSMYYYHGDHLGSTSVVTAGSGALSEEVSYYPYGSVKERVGSGSSYLFTDQEFDDESGLYYYGARYYNPDIMRFMQPDTITQDVHNPQNLNKYSYVLNNPIKYTDPSGQIIPALFVGIVLAGVISESLYLYTAENPTMEGTVWSGIVGGTSAAISGGVAIKAALAGAGTVGITAASGVGSGMATVFENIVKGEDPGKNVMQNALIGSATGLMGSSASKIINKNVLGVERFRHGSGKIFQYMIRGSDGTFTRGATGLEVFAHETVDRSIKEVMKHGLSAITKTESATAAIPTSTSTSTTTTTTTSPPTGITTTTTTSTTTTTTIWDRIIGMIGG